ncbi:MAG: SHOCT domain-containing protein [Actinobacteria bacterium]|jgi:type VI protein secretion system component VasK|nr:SHOCT domain-containing protein [Actinomycetota bacterium]
MNLGDALLWLVYFFFMIVYFMMIFWIIGDLFRRDDIGGFAKALWIIVLLFIPLLTMLIYVITQGSKMTERRMAEYGQLKAQQDAYIKNVARGDTSSQIKQAHDLLQSGAITQAEYDALKAKALS